MTNKQFLIVQIKGMLERHDLADFQRVRLLSLLAKHIRPARRKRKPTPAKPVVRPAKPAPFQRPASAPASPSRPDWLDSEVAQ